MKLPPYVLSVIAVCQATQQHKGMHCWYGQGKFFCKTTLKVNIGQIPFPQQTFVSQGGNMLQKTHTIC